LPYWITKLFFVHKSSDEDDFDPTKEKFRPRMHSGSRKQHATTAFQNNKDKPTDPQTEIMRNETKDESEVKGESKESNGPELKGMQERVRSMSECTSGNESDVGYRKTTRLTSEQLVSEWKVNRNGMEWDRT